MLKLTVIINIHTQSKLNVHYTHSSIEMSKLIIIIQIHIHIKYPEKCTRTCNLAYGNASQCSNESNEYAND